MSTEPEGVQSGSDAVDGSNASNFEVGNVQMSETLADPLNGQVQELIEKKDGDELEGCGSLASAGDHGIEKGNGFTDLEKEKESVNGRLDLGIGTQNVDVETNESEKKVPVDSVEGEKKSDGIQTELLVEKEMEPDMVYSHGANFSDVKGSDVRLECEDLGEDRKPDGSGEQEKKVEDMDFECFVDLEPHESKDENNLDDANAPVTAKVKHSDSDLVWAKVRSHPWWPGQVFDASAATDKAKKYFKKGSSLVTYFGDCTFAWNDASRIKPFRQHFSQMAKQSSLPDFLDAIDFALEEVSRRIEFGLACSCISEEVYQKIKTQNIINPGIREDSSSIHGRDKVSSAVFFEPASLVEYVKRLACSPSYDASDELQFVSHRAQLLAFNRRKGYTELPEFETLQGSVESAPKISPTEEKSSLFEVKVSVAEPKKTEQVYTKRKKKEDQDGCKHDGVFEYEDTTVTKKKKKDTTTAPKKKKKEQTLAEFIAEKRLSKSNGNISNENSGIKPDGEKKRKVVHSKLPKATKKIKANLLTEDPGSPVSPENDGKYNKITPQKARASFGIGASILRVANQMHCSTPTTVLPCSNQTSKMTSKNNGGGKKLQERSKAEESSEREISPPNETLSSLQSASATKTPSGELEQVLKKTPSNLKDSSKEQMVHEDRKEAANIAGEVTTKDNNPTEEDITGSDLKEQPDNKKCSDVSDSCCKEDFSTE